MERRIALYSLKKLSTRATRLLGLTNNTKGFDRRCNYIWADPIRQTWCLELDLAGYKDTKKDISLAC